MYKVMVLTYSFFFCQYLDEVTLSAQLSRRLAYGAARRISQMCNDSGCTSPRTQSPMLNASNNKYVSKPDFLHFVYLLLTFILYSLGMYDTFTCGSHQESLQNVGIFTQVPMCA
jgi:hypothetical protein